MDILSRKNALLSYLAGWIAIAVLMGVIVFGPGSTGKKAFNDPAAPTMAWLR